MCSTADLPLEAAALHETDPDYYKNTRFYKKNVDIEDIYAAWDNMIDPKDAPTLEQIVRSLAEAAPETPREFESALWGQLKRHKISCRKAQLLHTYQHLTRRTKSLAPSE